MSPVTGLQNYNESESWLNQVPDAAILVDPRQEGLPITAASAGFLELSGYERREVLGMDTSLLLAGVPAVAVSRSAKKNFEDFCKTSLKSGVSDIAESWHVHAYGRKDGSIFSAFVMMGLCRTQLGPYVVLVLLHVGEGAMAPRVTSGRSVELEEQAREVLRRTRNFLVRGEVTREAETSGDAENAFFSERLRDRAILFAGGSSAARREPSELPVGCLLFGGAPMAPGRGEGLQFALRVDEVASGFEGLPMLGFTRRQPVDSPGTYPAVAKCLGRSALVGGLGEATVRDQEEHFKVGFRKIPETEVATFSCQPGVQPHQRVPVAALAVGDVVGCRYTWEGHLQFWLNSVKLLDFDVGRPLEAEGLYWPVVDVAFSAAAVTWLPDLASHSRGVRRKATHPTISDISTVCPSGFPGACEEGDEDEEDDNCSVSDNNSDCGGSLEVECGQSSCRDEISLPDDGQRKETPARESSCGAEGALELRAAPVDKAFVLCFAAAAAAAVAVILHRAAKRST